MKETYAIHASSISYTYQEGTQALHDINFAVKPGEFVALLASNGSGKTTLIKVLTGLLKPQHGAVCVGGKNIKDLSSNELYQQVGVVLQNPNDQLFAPTVAEDVAFGPRNLGLPEAEIQRRVEESLQSVGALDLCRRAVHHLSFGQQKRVALAGVLAMQPSILILDEPTAGLDPAGEAQMMHLLRQLNTDKHITIILATHSVDMLPLFAKQIHIFQHGRVLRHGPVEEIMREREMLDQAGLRLPYISALLYEMKRYDGVPIDGLPLTVREARQRIMALIPEELIVKQLGENHP